jgi:hypothetical protein
MHRYVTIIHNSNACADAISITEKTLRNSVHQLRNNGRYESKEK